MKIAMIYDRIYPGSVGGAELRMYELAKYLVQTEEVTVYGDDSWVHFPEAALTECKYRILQRRSSTGRKRRSIFSPLTYTFSLLVSLFRSNEEVWDLVSFPYFHIPFVRVLALIRGKKVVVTWIEFWGDYWKEALPPGVSHVGRLVEKLAMKCSPRLIAISAHTRDRLVAAGAPPEKIDIVECGLHFSEIQSIPASADQCTLISVGRLIPHKRFDLAIRALALLPDHMVLTIVGDGPERSNLSSLAKELNVDERVQFLGFVEDHRDVLSKMKSAKALLQPSQREGFGMTLIESWACGIPVVVCEGIFNASATLVTHPSLGKVVSLEPQEIANACIDVLEMSEENRELRLEHARRYDWEVIAQSLRTVYQECVSRR